MPLGKRKTSSARGSGQRPEKICRLIEKKDKAEKLLRETLGEESANILTKGDVYRKSNQNQTTWADLPTECKANIFSYLTIFDKGKYAVINREWRDLLYAPGMWPRIELSDFNICRGIVSSYFGNTTGGFTPRTCHHTGCQTIAHRRMGQYLDFLTNIVRPCPKCVAFDLDIYSWNFATGIRWADYLSSFFESISCNALRRLTLKWKGTLQSWTYRSADAREQGPAQAAPAAAPALPGPLAPPMPHAAQPPNQVVVMQGPVGHAMVPNAGPHSRDLERNLLVNIDNGFHVGVGDGFEGTARRRVECFLRLFQLITSKAINLQSLEIPFDWSDKSVPNLSRLTRLRSLFMDTGLFLRSLPQDQVDHVLSSLVHLKALHLSERCPVQWGYNIYDIKSMSLELLDISQSNGLFLGTVDTPRLTTLLMQRPTHLMRIQAAIPCLHKVLRQGAPRLKNLNAFVLDSSPWEEGKKSIVAHQGCWSFSFDAETIFKKLCSCSFHRGHWRD